jgi:hypothetical protein
MHPQYTTLFTTIDEYARTRHRCFVAECFLFSEAEWTICTRPTNENTRALDVYACKYFRLSQREAEEVCKSNALGATLKERIDRELLSISDSVPD